VKTCDHKSVGVVITDQYGRYLLLTRARPPVGRAPVAGHVDEHGSPRETALAETREEAGLHLDQLRMLDAGHVMNICRRPPSHPTHDGHDWTIFGASVDDAADLRFSALETHGGDWYTAGRLQELVDRTVSYAEGELSEAQWQADPGLEPVWAYWLDRLELITVSLPGLRAIIKIFTAPPV
jgi:8-oxo-dGTP pyrophosphatase MutT (NUDIX family)